MTIDDATPRRSLARALWPDRAERRLLLRRLLRRRRDPKRFQGLPGGWRRRPRLAFWWTLLEACLEAPWLMGAALSVGPVWLVHTTWVWWTGH